MDVATSVRLAAFVVVVAVGIVGVGVFECLCGGVCVCVFNNNNLIEPPGRRSRTFSRPDK